MVRYKENFRDTISNSQKLLKNKDDILNKPNKKKLNNKTIPT